MRRERRGTAALPRSRRRSRATHRRVCARGPASRAPGRARRPGHSDPPWPAHVRDRRSQRPRRERAPPLQARQPRPCGGATTRRGRTTARGSRGRSAVRCGRTSPRSDGRGRLSVSRGHVSVTGMAAVLFVYAHPDDESFGIAGTAMKLKDEGHTTGLLTLTRGDAGLWFGRDKGSWTSEELARERAKEWHAATDIIGFADRRILEWPDGA